MKTGITYLSYLLTFIALVTFTQAYVPVDSVEIETPDRHITLLPFIDLHSAPAGDPVESILSSASFDFSFTATIRDSLKRARVAAMEHSIRRLKQPVIRVADRGLALEILAMLARDAHPVDPGVVRLRVAPWEKLIEKYAVKFDIDPNFIRAIIYAESNGDPDVVSNRGAMGLMQLMPDTADFVGITDPFDPEQNILGGVRYITWLMEYSSMFSEPYLLWAWHAGPAMPDRLLLPESTRDFILKVLDVKRRLDSSLSNPV